MALLNPGNTARSARCAGRFGYLSRQAVEQPPMSVKWANKALIALCLTLAITLVLMVYA